MHFDWLTTSSALSVSKTPFGIVVRPLIRWTAQVVVIAIGVGVSIGFASQNAPGEGFAAFIDQSLNAQWRRLLKIQLQLDTCGFTQLSDSLDDRRAAMQIAHRRAAKAAWEAEGAAQTAIAHMMRELVVAQTAFEEGLREGMRDSVPPDAACMSAQLAASQFQ